MSLDTPAAKRRRILNFRKLPKADFEKQLAVFATSGWSFERLTLLNGETVVEGDCVEINPGEDYSRTSSPEEKWIAELIEIKGEDSLTTSRKRYIKCRWFYTENNLRRYAVAVGNLASCAFGKNELVLSNHEQIIAAQSILCKVVVKFFDESVTDQVSIGQNDRWYRYELRTGRGATDNRLVLHGKIKLPHARCGVLTCRKRYDPAADSQRYCPREGCKVWYHVQCLRNAKFQKTNPDCYHRRLGAMIKGTPDFEGVPSDFLKDLKENMRLEQSGEPCGFPDYATGSICNIIWCAQSSICRGLNHGIVGNEETIQDARQMLREIWDQRDSRLYPSDEEVARFAKFKDNSMEPIFGCMRCGLAI